MLGRARRLCAMTSLSSRRKIAVRQLSRLLRRKGVRATRQRHDEESSEADQSQIPRSDPAAIDANPGDSVRVCADMMRAAIYSATHKTPVLQAAEAEFEDRPMVADPIGGSTR